MADRSHLTPVTVTDRRGRTTTVYRNPGGPAAAGQKQSRLIPAVAAPAAPTKLSPPAPLDEDRLATMAGRIEATYRPRVRGLSQRLMSEPAGRAAVALAAEQIAARSLSRAAAYRIVAVCFAKEPYGDAGGVLALDSLRIAARLAKRWPATGDGWVDDFLGAVVGARGSRTSGATTTTQLDSLTAVTDFILRDENRRNHTKTGSRSYWSYTKIANRDLEALIRQRPHDLDRIGDYIADRGMTYWPSDEVDALREWLDSTTDTAAVADGWL